MKKPITTLSVLLALFAALGITYIFKYNGAQTDLEQASELKSDVESQLLAHKNILAIDSLLVQGEYHRALGQYRNQLQDLQGRDNTGIALRMQLAERLLRLSTAEDTIQMAPIARVNLDSIDMEIKEEVTPIEILKYDSLVFALDKAKAKLASAQRQLKEKSFGEYLIFTSKKGSLMHYVGEVKNDKANGYGIALLETGSRYEGHWKNNERHGKGTFHWKDGQYYVGDYVNDRRNGEGTYYWPNGEKYAGEWKDDKRNGKGTFYDKDGKIVTQGVWADDVLVEKQKKP